MLVESGYIYNAYKHTSLHIFHKYIFQVIQNNFNNQLNIALKYLWLM